jgi:pSer/pThr/pTyr-binding forkhead associated (FHA) protein/tetratricopeptide (TPR) repeat protein
MKLILRIDDGSSNDALVKELGIGAFRVGRSDFCDVILQGKEISRSHLEIRVTDASVYITNMSSSGRVKLNGERVETAEIQDGDRIQLAQYKIYCQIEKDAVVESQPPSEMIEEPFVSSAASNEEEKPLPEIPLLQSEAPEQENVFEAEVPQAAEVKEFPIQERWAQENVYEGALALKTENTAVENQAVVAKLIFTDGPLAGSEIPLQGYEVTMGRSRKVDIFLDDEKLSRKHAKITRVGNGYRLVDLESRNGTYVNGVRILEHPLHSFDVIELGKSKIKFLILDVGIGIFEKGGDLQPLPQQSETKSVQLVVEPPPMEETPVVFSPKKDADVTEKLPRKSNKRNLILGAVLVMMLGLFFMVPTEPQPEGSQSNEAAVTNPVQDLAPKPNLDANLTPSIPKEFSELLPQAQIKVEGNYNNAIRFQEREDFETALRELRDLHTLVPYYKESKKLEALYVRKVKEKQKQDATEKAQRDRYAELQIFLEEGVDYLKQGNFERAAENFNAAIILDPQNATAAKGLKAAQLQIRDIEQLPPEVDPEMEKKKLVTQLMEQALIKFEEKSYQEAINLAEQVRSIEIRGETEYLNQAKQLIDKSKIQQKEEFEPFLIQAKEKFAEGDYNLSRDLCDEMLKRDPSYDAAQECSLRARKQLNRLAKEAYTHGYILESMNRIEEAKQYWNRAKNYVRPGDPYYDKIQRKLDNYQ